jgi:immunity protein, SdpI family
MTRFYVILSVILTAAALAASLILYPQLPAKIPIHWNIHGQIDGYGDKAWAAFLMPAILAGLLLLFAVLPWLSPKPFAVDSFRDTYWFIALAITGGMAFIHGLMLWAAVAGPIDITRALLAGLLLIFGLIGNVMGKVRRNFWMGVRTPWTLANERVWNDTHRLAGRLFVAAAVLGLPLLLLPLPQTAIAIAIFILIMIAALWPAIYSLILYKRLELRGEI